MLVIAQQTRYYVYTGNTFLYTKCLHFFLTDSRLFQSLVGNCIFGNKHGYSSFPLIMWSWFNKIALSKYPSSKWHSSYSGFGQSRVWDDCYVSERSKNDLHCILMLVVSNYNKLFSFSLSLDCISLKRRRNFEADKELKRRGLNPVDWKAERKEACFVFKAEIPTTLQVVTCKSRVFQCSKSS